ncbi:MAG: N5-glutamine methyltransferase family protein [Phycisphaerales bacterium]
MGDTTAAPNTQWTTRRLLEWMQRAFESKGLDETRRSAEILLEHVLDCRRMDLYIAPDRPASPEELTTLRALVTAPSRTNRCNTSSASGRSSGSTSKWIGGPLFHARAPRLSPKRSSSTRRTGRLGKVTFGEIKPLGGDTPAGEPNAEVASNQEASEPFEPPAQPTPADGSGILIADIGTGTGCIALALLRNIPGAKAFATDVSEDALALAAENAESLGLSNRFKPLLGNLLEPLLDYPGVAKAAESGRGALDYLVSNPPYIPDHEWNDPDQMGKNVKGHEPDLALRGGADGLEFVRPIIENGPRLLKPGGLLLIEIASSCADTVFSLAKANALLHNPVILNDLEGKARTLRAERRR